MTKNLSSPFSTGGGGAHFEAHVQSLFVVLMLTGGCAPCLPSWPIVELKLQGEVEGYETDDLIIFVEDKITGERRRLLGQVTRSVKITNSDQKFGKVINDGWEDFNNSNNFTKNKDKIALLTGPLGFIDINNVLWILNQARRTKDVDQFLSYINEAKFSPSKSQSKLEVFKNHLRIANNGEEVPKEDLYSFLNHFEILSFDLGQERGVILSLAHSYISLFKSQIPEYVWSRIVDFVQTWNQDSGTITPEKLPEDVVKLFEHKATIDMPSKFKSYPRLGEKEWAKYSDENLALANLIGSWDGNNDSDISIVEEFLGIKYENWVKKAREILGFSDSPLSYKSEVWEISNRIELSKYLGSVILDRDLERFKASALTVLKEKDPAFDLPVEERYAASLKGKVLNHSPTIRKGIAEGLAILANNPKVFSKCSPGKPEGIAAQTVQEIVNDEDWILWGSLENLLPTLAEAAPEKFLEAVEKALDFPPCPFDKLFSQEGKGIFGSNYMTGVLWALERLAWDEKYLVRVCIVLGELASRDPWGQWSNRPFNSLVTILLPWLPHTFAPFEKRKVAIQTLLRENSDIGWELLINLLPSQTQTVMGSSKPEWRMTVPEDEERGVSKKEYWEQISSYANIAICNAGKKIDRLSKLIDNFDVLPLEEFDKLIKVLNSSKICQLEEKERFVLWDHLRKFVSKHRKFSDADWSLPERMLSQIEKTKENLNPTDLKLLYKPLFSDPDFDLYEKEGSWQKQQEKLVRRRDKAIWDIFQQEGLDGVLQLAEIVKFPELVGKSLGVIDAPEVDKSLLPEFLDSDDQKNYSLVKGFIWTRYQKKGWEWCDQFERSEWSNGQLGKFLAALPCEKETWNRASYWLEEEEGEYWARANIKPCKADKNLEEAVKKLMEFEKLGEALYCLYQNYNAGQPVSIELCVQVLLDIVELEKFPEGITGFHIVELIKYLQADPSVSREVLYKIEWEYLPLLKAYRDAVPQFLEEKLANEPKFFCEVISMIYRSKHEVKSQKKPSEEEQAIAKNAWTLLYEWKTPPGIKRDGSFNSDQFKSWVREVKDISSQTGHLEVSLIKIGEVLIHSPKDPDGLWIHRSIAEELNDRDSQEMRRGFEIATYNSRGAFFVDPTGKPEKELAGHFDQKAEEVENEGFQRLASTLRRLAQNYEKEAEQIKRDHGNR